MAKKKKKADGGPTARTTRAGLAVTQTIPLDDVMTALLNKNEGGANANEIQENSLASPDSGASGLVDYGGMNPVGIGTDGAPAPIDPNPPGFWATYSGAIIALLAGVAAWWFFKLAWYWALAITVAVFVGYRLLTAPPAPAEV